MPPPAADIPCPPPAVALRLASPCCVRAGLRPATPPPPRPARAAPARPACNGTGGRACEAFAQAAAAVIRISLLQECYASSHSKNCCGCCCCQMPTRPLPLLCTIVHSPFTPANCCCWPGTPTRPPGACPKPICCCKVGARPPPAPSRCCAPNPAWLPAAPCRPPSPGLQNTEEV